ncbi:MAG: GGDEF domain-containing protein [bacterium]|nr:GGDEF domain-containing protein [bacterium]
MSIYLYNKDDKVFICNGANGLDNKKLTEIFDSSYFIKFMRDTEQILIHKDLSEKFRDFKSQDFQEIFEVFKNLDAEIILPLISSELVGFISIGRKRNNTKYTSNDMLMYRYLMIVAAIKVHGLLLKEESEIDPLTNSYNRRSFNTWMNRLLLLSKKEIKPLVLISIDLDFFKKINDNFGHAHGDLVLQEFVIATKTYLKANDMIFRMGGEEFIIILVGANKEGAEKFRKHLLEAIKHNATITTLTLSMGLVEFLPDTDSTSRTQNLHCIQRVLLKAGDNATYRAKSEGRNRMCYEGYLEIKKLVIIMQFIAKLLQRILIILRDLAHTL